MKEELLNILTYKKTDLNLEHNQDHTQSQLSIQVMESMTTSCGHTLDKSLIADKCPTCYKPITPGELRKNIALQSVIELLKKTDDNATLSSIEDELISILTCPIGLGTFNDPVTLLCGHTIEREFLETHLNTQTNKSCCPCCKQVILKSACSSDFMLIELGEYLTKNSAKYAKERLEISSEKAFEKHIRILLEKNDFEKVSELLKGKLTTFLINNPEYAIKKI